MKIAIAGAGNVGRSIARELLENGHHVLLIDRDPKALKMDSVPNAEWLMADVCEITSLDNAKLDSPVRPPTTAINATIRETLWLSPSCFHKSIND